MTADEFNHKTDELAQRRARASGAMLPYIRAVLDAYEDRYQASESVYTELRRHYDAYIAAHNAYLDHILERPTP